MTQTTIDRPDTNKAGSKPILQPIKSAMKLNLDPNSIVPPGLSTPPTALALLLALQRRWKKGVLVGAVLATIAALAAFLLVPSSQYTAQSTMRVASNNQGILKEFQAQDGQIQFQIFQQSQIALVKSQLVLGVALNKPGVAELPSVKAVPPALRAEWLEKKIQVEFPNGSEIMKISMNGNDETEIQTIVKAVTDAYMEEVVKKEKNTRRQQRKDLEDIYEKYGNELEAYHKQIHDLQRVARSKDGGVQVLLQKMAVERLGTEQRNLLKAQADRKDAEHDLEVARSKEQSLAKRTIPDYSINEALQKDPEYIRFENDISLLRAQIAKYYAEYDRRFAERYAREDEAKIEVIRQARDSYRNRVRPIYESQFRGKELEEQRKTVADLEAKIAKLKNQEKDTEATVLALAKDTNEQQEAFMALDKIQLDIEKKDKITKKLGEEIERLKIEEGNPDRIKELESAVLARSKDSKRKYQAAGMSWLAVFVLTLFAISWLEFSSRRVFSPEQISQGLGIKVLGSLPESSPALCSNILAKPSSPYEVSLLSMHSEAVDAARSMLLHAARVQGLKSVMVTSAASGEGKTTLASHLALSLSKAGIRTLLVDGDLRNPHAHQCLGLTRNAGLSEILRGELEAGNAVQSTPFQNLFLLSAGHCDPRTIQTLAGHQFSNLMKQLKHQFEFIIVDSCPVLTVADALAMGQSVEGVIVSVKRDVSQLRKVHQATQRLTTFGLNVIGAVVNGTRDEVYDSAYQYPKILGT